MIRNLLKIWVKRHTRFIWIILIFCIFSAAFTITASYYIYKYWFPAVFAINNNDIGSQAILHTNKGDIKIKLTSRARNATAQFTRYAREGFYDGTRFTRIVKNLMIEGGDPLSKYDNAKNLWGMGGSSAVFKNETFIDDKFEPGTVAMTGSAYKTFGSQFFISTANTTWLARKHTIIGHVIEGMDIVKSIEDIRTDAMNQPEEEIIINKITIL